ncbi:hypothetical protein AAMO2058_000816200 [Amorphochlora amoebiformis]
MKPFFLLMMVVGGTSNPTSLSPTQSPSSNPTTTSAPTLSQQIMADMSNVVIAEGAGDALGVKLMRQPTGTLYVQMSSSYDIVSATDTFTFDSSNWNSYQYVQFWGKEDTITEGHENVTITVSLTADGLGNTIQTLEIPATVTEIISYDSFTPALGWMTGGTEVVVSMNQSFVDSTVTSIPPLYCYFGSQRVNGTLTGSRGIKCTAPTCQEANRGMACTGTELSVLVKVEVSNAITYSSLYYTYLQEPSIISISPSTGKPCCVSDEVVTVELDILTSMIHNIDALAHCKFGYLTSKATHVRGTNSFECLAPIRYDLNGDTSSTEEQLWITLNGQQYTSSSKTFTYYDEQGDFDNLVLFWTIIAIVGGVCLWIFLTGVHCFCFGKRKKNNRKKPKEPTGAISILEHISKDLLRESVEELENGAEIVHAVEVQESCPWTSVPELDLWKRILCIRCGYSMGDLEFEMAKPFSELDIRLADAWLFLFEHEFDDSLAISHEDLTERSRLGPFGHWPVMASKPIQGYMTKAMSRRAKTMERVKIWKDARVSMDIQIRFMSSKTMLSALNRRKVNIKVRDSSGAQIAECNMLEQMAGGVIQMSHMSFDRSSIENLDMLLVFEMRADSAGWGDVQDAIRSTRAVGDDETKSLQSTTNLLGNERVRVVARGKKVIGKCTVSFYDLYDLSASHRRIYGTYENLEGVPIATVTFSQNVEDFRQKSDKKKSVFKTGRKEPRAGNLEDGTNDSMIATAKQTQVI